MMAPISSEKTSKKRAFSRAIKGPGGRDLFSRRQTRTDPLFLMTCKLHKTGCEAATTQDLELSRKKRDKSKLAPE